MKSVRTAIRLFEAVATRQPVGLSELSRSLEVPKPSVQRALDTLHAAGWLRRDLSDPGRWCVSARFAVLADKVPVAVAPREVSRPHLSALRDETGLVAGLFVLDDGQMVFAAGDGATRPGKVAHEPLPIHASAAGHAVLSRLPSRTRQEMLERSLRLSAEASRTAPSEVLNAVAAAERDGYAVVVGGYREDVTAVAAPVVNRNGMPVAAVAVLATGDRLATDAVSRVGALVVRCARAISDELALVI